ncbi:MAG TPA: Mu transposase C-terminal domain-containing protein [Candidatus Dojkabacteria bacterium]
MKRKNRDVYSYSGGNISDGIRVVKKGGKIKFDGCWFENREMLSEYVGEYVRVYAEDCFFSYRIPVFHYHGGFICYAHVIKRKVNEK